MPEPKVASYLIREREGRKDKKMEGREGRKEGRKEGSMPMSFLKSSMSCTPSSSPTGRKGKGRDDRVGRKEGRKEGRKG